MKNKHATVIICGMNAQIISRFIHGVDEVCVAVLQ